MLEMQRRCTGHVAEMCWRYTGSSCAASALAMNKLHTKKVWLSSGLPTAKFVTVSPDSNFEKVWEDIGDAFVKPAKEGSSYGVSPAHSLSELKAAVAHAREFDASVIVESLIDGPEYSVSILGNQVLPAIEIINHRIKCVILSTVIRTGKLLSMLCYCITHTTS